MWLGLVLAQHVAAEAARAPCPDDMVRVTGQHWEHVERLCRRTKPEKKCIEYQPGLVVLEPGVTPVDVCMDRYEWPNKAGALPVVMITFGDAETECAALGKRLCTEFEWELACEGAEHRPWPYGWRQVTGNCNSDKPYRAYDEAKINSSDDAIRNKEVTRLWQGAPSGSHAACASVFGVMDLTGNVEEWVRTSRAEWPLPSSLKGGFWSKPWAGCRGTNERHGGKFRYYEIGFRCCKEPAR
jgi:formylglycine-generating enzyme required for sulfatase activity